MPRRIVLVALVSLISALCGVQTPVGAAEPWIPLFNGKDLAGWETYLDKPTGKSEPIGVNKDPNKVFTVLDDGVLRISGETFGVLSTLQEYENYHLRLEMKWGEKRWPPRENAIRDSGICYHAHDALGRHGPWTKSHECQIQEGDFGDYFSLQTAGSFTLSPDGATFDPAGPMRDPSAGRVIRSANHEKPHGEWNTIEVICQGDTATHVVNGKIVNRLSHSRRRVGDKAASLTRGRIQLQSEAAEVFYRNIELRALPPESASASQPALRPTAPPEGLGIKALFNGKDLTGWDGDPRLWRFENGVIVGESTPHASLKTNTFLIYRGAELTDFELRFSYRISGGNSGVQYRSERVDSANDPANTWRVRGYQAEIAGLAGKDGFFYHEGGEKTRGYPEKSRYLCYVGDKVVIDETGKSNSVGRLADNAALAQTYRKGDWNDYIIIARGNTIMQFLNGYQTTEAVDNDPKNALKAGVLALQLHQGPPMKVEFRNLRMKPLDAAP